ncbi:hypothetical protein QJQ45_027958, partial [Haematococcus lacustris]
VVLGSPQGQSEAWAHLGQHGSCATLVPDDGPEAQGKPGDPPAATATLADAAAPAPAAAASDPARLVCQVAQALAALQQLQQQQQQQQLGQAGQGEKEQQQQQDQQPQVRKGQGAARVQGARAPQLACTATATSASATHLPHAPPPAPPPDQAAVAPAATPLPDTHTPAAGPALSTSTDMGSQPLSCARRTKRKSALAAVAVIAEVGQAERRGDSDLLLDPREALRAPSSRHVAKPRTLASSRTVGAGSKPSATAGGGAVNPSGLPLLPLSLPFPCPFPLLTPLGSFGQAGVAAGGPGEVPGVLPLPVWPLLPGTTQTSPETLCSLADLSCMLGPAPTRAAVQGKGKGQGQARGQAKGQGKDQARQGKGCPVAALLDISSLLASSGLLGLSCEALPEAAPAVVSSQGQGQGQQQGQGQGQGQARNQSESCAAATQGLGQGQNSLLSCSQAPTASASQLVLPGPTLSEARGPCTAAPSSSQLPSTTTATTTTCPPTPLPDSLLSSFSYLQPLLQLAARGSETPCATPVKQQQQPPLPHADLPLPSPPLPQQPPLSQLQVAGSEHITSQHDSSQHATQQHVEQQMQLSCRGPTEGGISHASKGGLRCGQGLGQEQGQLPSSVPIPAAAAAADVWVNLSLRRDGAGFTSAQERQQQQEKLQAQPEQQQQASPDIMSCCQALPEAGACVEACTSAPPTMSSTAATSACPHAARLAGLSLLLQDLQHSQSQCQGLQPPILPSTAAASMDPASTLALSPEPLPHAALPHLTTVPTPAPQPVLNLVSPLPPPPAATQDPPASPTSAPTAAVTSALAPLQWPPAASTLAPTPSITRIASQKPDSQHWMAKWGDGVQLADMPLGAVLAAAGELAVRIHEEQRRLEVARAWGVLQSRPMTLVDHAEQDGQGLHTSTADCACLVCRCDLFISAVVSPAAPGLCACPEHAAALGASPKDCVLLIRFSVQQLQWQVDRVVRLWPEAQQQVDAALARVAAKRVAAVRCLGPIVMLEGPDTKATLAQDPVYRDVTILDPFDPEQLAQLQATAPDVACAASRALALPDSLLLALAHAAPEDQPQLPTALPDAQACPAWSLRPPLHTVAPHGAPGLAPGCAVAAGSHQRLPKLEDPQHSVQDPLKGLGHVRDLVEGGSKAATKSTDTSRAGALCRGARGSEGASDVPLVSQEAEQEVALPGADRAAAGKEEEEEASHAQQLPFALQPGHLGLPPWGSFTTPAIPAAGHAPLASFMGDPPGAAAALDLAAGISPLLRTCIPGRKPVSSARGAAISAGIARARQEREAAVAAQATAAGGSGQGQGQGQGVAAAVLESESEEDLDAGAVEEESDEDAKPAKRRRALSGAAAAAVAAAAAAAAAAAGPGGPSSSTQTGRLGMAGSLRSHRMGTRGSAASGARSALQSPTAATTLVGSKQGGPFAPVFSTSSSSSRMGSLDEHPTATNTTTMMPGAAAHPAYPPLLQLYDGAPHPTSTTPPPLTAGCQSLLPKMVATARPRTQRWLAQQGASQLEQPRPVLGLMPLTTHPPAAAGRATLTGTTPAPASETTPSPSSSLPQLSALPPLLGTTQASVPAQQPVALPTPAPTSPSPTTTAATACAGTGAAGAAGQDAAPLTMLQPDPSRCQAMDGVAAVPAPALISCIPAAATSSPHAPREHEANSRASDSSHAVQVHRAPSLSTALSLPHAPALLHGPPTDPGIAASPAATTAGVGHALGGCRVEGGRPQRRRKPPAGMMCSDYVLDYVPNWPAISSPQPPPPAAAVLCHGRHADGQAKVAGPRTRQATAAGLVSGMGSCLGPASPSTAVEPGYAAVLAAPHETLSTTAVVTMAGAAATLPTPPQLLPGSAPLGLVPSLELTASPSTSSGVHPGDSAPSFMLPQPSPSLLTLPSRAASLPALPSTTAVVRQTLKRKPPAAHLAAAVAAALSSSSSYKDLGDAALLPSTPYCMNPASSSSSLPSCLGGALAAQPTHAHGTPPEQGLSPPPALQTLTQPSHPMNGEATDATPPLQRSLPQPGAIKGFVPCTAGSPLHTSAPLLTIDSVGGQATGGGGEGDTHRPFPFSHKAPGHPLVSPSSYANQETAPLDTDPLALLTHAATAPALPVSPPPVAEASSQGVVEGTTKQQCRAAGDQPQSSSSPPATQEAVLDMGLPTGTMLEDLYLSTLPNALHSKGSSLGVSLSPSPPLSEAAAPLPRPQAATFSHPAASRHGGTGSTLHSEDMACTGVGVCTQVQGMGSRPSSGQGQPCPSGQLMPEDLSRHEDRPAPGTPCAAPDLLAAAIALQLHTPSPVPVLAGPSPDPSSPQASHLTNPTSAFSVMGLHLDGTHLGGPAPPSLLSPLQPSALLPCGSQVDEPGAFSLTDFAMPPGFRLLGLDTSLDLKGPKSATLAAGGKLAECEEDLASLGPSPPPALAGFAGLAGLAVWNSLGVELGGSQGLLVGSAGASPLHTHSSHGEDQALADTTDIMAFF